MGARARLNRLSGYDVLLLSSLLWFLAKFLRYALPPLFASEAFRSEVGASNVLLGAAFTAMMGVYALMQFPSGALADRLGASKVVAGGGGVAAGGAFVLAVPTSGGASARVGAGGGVPLGFLLLVAGMLLVGLGTGAHKTVAIRLLARAYPARTGRAIGALDTVGAFGGVAAPAAVVFFVDVADWHALFLVGGVAAVGLTVAFAARVPNRVSNPDERTHGDGHDEDGEAANVRERDGGGGEGEVGGPTGGGRDGGRSEVAGYLGLFRDARFAAFVGVTLCFSFAYNGAIAFLPLYLTEQAGLESGIASFIYSGLFVVSLVQLFTGDLSDRAGRLPMVGVTLALAAAGLLALLAVGTAGPFVLGAAVVVFGLGSHGFRPVRSAYLTAVIPADIAGGGLGVVRTLSLGAGAVAPVLVGTAADAADFGVAFAALAGSMVGAVVLTGVVALSGDE